MTLVRPQTRELGHFLSDFFGLPRERITSDLSYQSVPEWDSLRHMSLVVALEREYAREIPDEDMKALTTAEGIAGYLGVPLGDAHPDGGAEGGAEGGAGLTGRPATPVDGGRAPARGPDRGLAGVTLDRSTITLVDADTPRLQYRGYDVAALSRRHRYEDVVHLLVHGELSAAAAVPQAELWAAGVRAGTALPPWTGSLTRLEDCTLAVLAAGTELGRVAPWPREPRTPDEAERWAPWLIGAMIGGTAGVVRQARAERPGHPLLGHPLPDHPAMAALLASAACPPALVGTAARYLESAMILQADHGSCASTTAVRVTASTGAGLLAALHAGVATFCGPLHGGAIVDAAAMLGVLVRGEADAPGFVEATLGSGRAVPGFGHRVYRKHDPRTVELRRMVTDLGQDLGRPEYLRAIDDLVQVMRPMRKAGAMPNVDLYSAALFALLGIPSPATVLVFLAARTAGWVAHAVEQMHARILIRPLLEYVGDVDRLAGSDVPAACEAVR